MTPEEIKEKTQTRYCNAKTVTIHKVEIEKSKYSRGQEILIGRIRLSTDVGDITYKPKKEVTNNSNIAGLDIVSTETEEYSLTEFLMNNTFIKQLAIATKDNLSVEAVVSYTEFGKHIESEDQVVYYKFMRNYQFESIYVEQIHKDDKTNLKAQQERANKHNTVEIPTESEVKQNE